MPFKDFVNGSRLDDTDVNRYWLQQAHVIKTVDEQVVNSTTLQNDDELFLPLLANTDYWLEGFIKYSAPESRDIRINFSLPSNTQFDILHNGLRSGHVSTDPLPVRVGLDNVSRSRFTEVSTGGTIGGIGSDNSEIGVIPLEGRIIVGNNSGTLQMTFAQVSAASGTGTVVRSGSCLILQRLTA